MPHHIGRTSAGTVPGSKRNSVRIRYVVITVIYGCNDNSIDDLFMGRKLGRNSRAAERVT